MNRPTKFCNTMTLKMIFLFSLFYLPLAKAEWRITFSQDQLIDNPYNRKIITALAAALPNYPSHANPTLRFVFHQSRNSEQRWENLSRHIPALKHRQYEIYNTPDVNALSIYLQQEITDRCPAKIVIKDPEMPSQSVYFPVQSSGVFILSKQAKIEVSKQGQKFQIALYNREKDRIETVKNRFFSLAGQEIEEALTIGIFSNSAPAKLDANHITSQWQETSQEEIGEVRQKAATLSSIPISSLHFDKSEKQWPSDACFLHLKPSLNPSQH